MKEPEILPPSALPRVPGASVFLSTEDGLFEVLPDGHGDWTIVPVTP